MTTKVISLIDNIKVGQGDIDLSHFFPGQNPNSGGKLANIVAAPGGRIKQTVVN